MKVVNIRLAPEELDRLDRLAARLPGVRRSSLGADLLRRALDRAEADPSVLVAPAPAPTGRVA